MESSLDLSTDFLETKNDSLQDQEKEQDISEDDMNKNAEGICLCIHVPVKDIQCNASIFK